MGTGQDNTHASQDRKSQCLLRSSYAHFCLSPGLTSSFNGESKRINANANKENRLALRMAVGHRVFTQDKRASLFPSDMKRRRWDIHKSSKVYLAKFYFAILG